MYTINITLLLLFYNLYMQLLQNMRWQPLTK